MELGLSPARAATYSLIENPGKLDHLVCCRDVEWRHALCGYIAKDTSLMHDSDIVCTGCIEAAEGMGALPGDRQCPLDNRPCPDEAEMQRMIDERISGT
ncbi:hypothetical protein AAIH32_11920 [Pseudarthrobacter oxydans]|uniref:hypothetical protein n=1 Tax=Pseudarthrobacter oxydans TaxID=1671 RepID=UPI003D29CECD